ncbi:MAG: NUDIX domain-containing protein [Candidatus Pacearchaeota archaeon]
MENDLVLKGKKRQEILKELEQGSKKFVELKKLLGLNSNILSYNLKILLKMHLISKEGVFYSLTKTTKYLMPYIRKIENSLIPLPCIATIVIKDNKILVRKKEKEPEKGKGIFIGGRISLGEDIFQAAKRHVKEKTGIDIKDLKLICINNYLSKDSQNINSHFVVFFVKAKPLGEPRNAEWKNSDRIKEKMFPDNKFIIKNMLNNKKTKFINSIYNEDTDKFKVVNIS